MRVVTTVRATMRKYSRILFTDGADQALEYPHDIGVHSRDMTFPIKFLLCIEYDLISAPP
jgi:hypothetical protein